jgi:hypothetical protein
MNQIQISEELGDDNQEVRKVLSRLKSQGVLVNLSRGEWGLAARPMSTVNNVDVPVDVSHGPPLQGGGPLVDNAKEKMNK